MNRVILVVGSIPIIVALSGVALPFVIGFGFLATIVNVFLVRVIFEKEQAAMEEIMRSRVFNVTPEEFRVLIEHLGNRHPPSFDEQMQTLGRELRSASAFLDQALEPDIDPHEIASDAATRAETTPNGFVEDIDDPILGVETRGVGELVRSPLWAKPIGGRTRRLPRYKSQ